MSLVPLVEKEGASAAQSEFLGQVPPLNLFKAFAHAPRTAILVARLGGTILYASKLDARIREAAILRVGYLLGCLYEVHHHVFIGKQVGLTDGDLAAIEAGDADAVDTDVGLAVRWADGCVRSGKASPEVVSEAVRHLGAEVAVELSVVVGYYTMVAQFLGSFEVPVEVGSVLKIDERPDAL